ncbi:hypothetical protein BKD30_07130 [Tersicoccus phoenicis]|uniref:MobA-like NTP transferase domain-containing protein n=1 Tax=Tersicoccus phoenicis TaxID=554083 RepID=A0A1R1LB66_9MICC|nr:NTP transferase domain-containing protein [Tersicoccus phoenicis]OMH24781.1 hypothetical protein BKD30_07130 [Tersicoccus phoenicis]
MNARGEPHLAAVVLAGGRGSRLGGVDKAALTLDGRRLLDRVLDAVEPVATVVVVGPEPAAPRRGAPGGTGGDAGYAGDADAGPGTGTEPIVRYVRDDPPFGGPAAATAAGLAALESADHEPAGELRAGALPPGTVSTSARGSWVLLLSCDLVHPGAAVDALVPALAAAGPETEAVVGVDPGGRRQPLIAGYRRDALTAAVVALTAARGELASASMRTLTGGLATVEVPLTSTASADVDTVEDAHRAGVRLPDHEPRRTYE